jgi:hypothetical protein
MVKQADRRPSRLICNTPPENTDFLSDSVGGIAENKIVGGSDGICASQSLQVGEKCKIMGGNGQNTVIFCPEWWLVKWGQNQ